MSGRTIEELQVGMAAEFTKAYDEWDIYTFAALTGDLNPTHVDEEFAQQTIFQEKIAHGMLTASLISAVLGMRLPGPGSIYLSQELRFLLPVSIGDTITARVEVIELMKEKNLARLRTTCTNQKGEQVLEGTALVRPPKAELLEEVKAAPLDAGTAREERRTPSGRRRGFLVGERMRRNPLTISPEASLSEARAFLDQHQIRHLPVVEGEALVGIITGRHIIHASLPSPPGRPTPETEALLSLIKVGEVMTRPVITTNPGATIGEAAKLLVAHKIGGLPVLEHGCLVGIITKTDIVEALVELLGM